MIRVSGSRENHNRYINRSYRNRGYLLRIQMINLNINSLITRAELKKIAENKNLKNRMNPYSLRKSNTNPILLYSTLKPLTSSLSPSAKSKGARFSSLRTRMRYRINIQIKFIEQYLMKYSLFQLITILIIQIEKAISQETLWDLIRIPPSSLYLDFLMIPTSNLQYTNTPSRHRKNSREYSNSMKVNL